MRRKELGGGEPHCLYCPEEWMPCLELDHPVGQHRDRDFEQVVCRNCHRKIEFERDMAGLTKNGLHDTSETPRQSSRSYLLLQAMHLEMLGDLLESTPGSAQSGANALRATAQSLRRKAKPAKTPKKLDRTQAKARTHLDLRSRPQLRHGGESTRQ